MKIFEINGYFKDNGDAILAAVVCEFDQDPDPKSEFAEEAIFHYGLSEGDIKYAIDEKSLIDNEFYITSYVKLSDNA
jgi:hypothetical protein